MWVKVGVSWLLYSLVGLEFLMSLQCSHCRSMRSVLDYLEAMVKANMEIEAKNKMSQSQTFP